MTEGQSGGKDRQASFPTKRPLEKLVKKRNPHRQDSSVAAWSPYCRCGSSRPFRDCSWKRHSLAEAREPTSLARRCWSSGGVRHRPALSPKWHGPTRVVQHHLTGPPCGSQAPLPSFQSSGRPGFPVRVGCSRTVMVPRWVLVPLVFRRSSFEDRLSNLVFVLSCVRTRLRALPTNRCLLATRHLSENHSPQPANRRAWSGSILLGEPSRMATGVFRLSSEEAFREDRGCCRLTSLLTQRRDRYVSNQKKSTFRNSHCIHLTYKQLWITVRG